MTESNGQPSKSSRMAALTNTSYGIAHDQLTSRLRWLLMAVGVLSLLVVALAWWQQGPG
jgi:hypothetical protein